LLSIFCTILGYENKDWYIPSPALNEDEVDTASLSKEYIRETLNYFRKYMQLFSITLVLKLKRKIDEYCLCY